MILFSIAFAIILISSAIAIYIIKKEKVVEKTIVNEVPVIKEKVVIQEVIKYIKFSETIARGGRNSTNNL